MTLLPAWSQPFVEPVDLPGGIPVTPDWAFTGSDGAGVRVAVVDSGIDHDHPRAYGPWTPGTSLEWDAGRSTVVETPGGHDDLFGHGTACAGIIRRAAPRCELMSVRVLGSRLTGRGETFVAGIRWAVAHGARVVNLSLSSGKAALVELFHDVADEAAHAGAVLVCAMNNVPAATYPSQFSSVISVASCAGDDPAELLANPQPPADFAAPGLDVDVAWLGGGTIVATGNSFAAPHVSGLVAAMLAKHPHLTPYEAKAVLRTVARNVGTKASHDG